MCYLEEQLNIQKARLNILEKERDRLINLYQSGDTIDKQAKNYSSPDSVEKINKKIDETYSELSVMKIRRLMTLL